MGERIIRKILNDKKYFDTTEPEEAKAFIKYCNYMMFNEGEKIPENMLKDYFRGLYKMVECTFEDDCLEYMHTEDGQKHLNETFGDCSLLTKEHFNEEEMEEIEAYNSTDLEQNELDKVFELKNTLV